MSIPKHVQQNFDTLLRAAREQNLGLLECKDAETGEVRYVLTAVGWNGKEFVMTPFGHLCPDNPYDAYVPPDMTEGASLQ